MTDIEKRARVVKAQLREQVSHHRDLSNPLYMSAHDRLLHEAAEVIAALTPQWQPIETAPRDWGSTIFDVWQRNGERIADCWWGTPTYGAKTPCVIYQCGYDSDGPVCEAVTDATHWMPLPAAPEVSP